MPDPIFPKGMSIKRRDNAPDFVIGRLSIKLEDFIVFAQEHESNGWINFDLKKKKSDGSPYIELDTWKPNQQSQEQPQGQQPQNPTDDINF
jgi:hypothetical protein